MALFSKLNIGYRHLMPSIAAVLPLAAWGFGQMFMLAGKAGIARWKRWGCCAVPGVLVLWNAWDSMSVYPHSLAYFSPCFGGPSTAYEHVCDSSLDWGQDILNIRRSLQDHGVPLDGSVPLYMVYFGCVPESFAGLDHVFLHPYAINAKRLEDMLYELEPGWYVVSATALHGGLNNELLEILMGNPGMLREFKSVFYELLEKGVDEDVEIHP